MYATSLQIHGIKRTVETIKTSMGKKTDVSLLAFFQWELAEQRKHCISSKGSRDLKCNLADD